MDASRKRSATLLSVSLSISLVIEQTCVEWLQCRDKKIKKTRKTMATTKSDGIDRDERCAKGFIALRWLSRMRAHVRLRLIWARLTAVKPKLKSDREMCRWLANSQRAILLGLAFHGRCRPSVDCLLPACLEINEVFLFPMSSREWMNAEFAAFALQESISNTREIVKRRW